MDSEVTFGTPLEWVEFTLGERVVRIEQVLSRAIEEDGTVHVRTIAGQWFALNYWDTFAQSPGAAFFAV